MVSLRTQLAAALLSALVYCGSASAQEKLLLTSMSPPGTLNERFFKPWADRVNEQAKGTIAIEIRSGSTLANFANVYNRVVDDVVQIGWLLHGLTAGQFPLSEVGTLPFILDGAEEGSVTLWQLYKSGALDAEYRDVVPLMFAVFPQNQIHLSKAPKSPDNLSGLKIAASSKTQSDVIQRLGATPVSVQTSELYEALQRGTIDGMIIGWAVFPAFKFGEVTSYHIEAPVGSSASMLFMSRKKLESLPAAARKAIEDNGNEAGTDAWGKHYDDAPKSPDGKRTVVRLTPEQLEQWRRQVGPVLDDWAGSRKDGAKILAQYKSLVADYRAQSKK
jgi:TRAP-type C4-dicarboxylate transport system substrate-binding protein